MDSVQIRSWLESRGATVNSTMDREISLSSHYLRALVDGVPTFVAGGERQADERIDALVDAIHWCRHRHPQARRVVLMVGTVGDGSDAEVLDALAILREQYQGSPSLDLWHDREPASRPPPDLSGEGQRWLKFFHRHSAESVPATLRVVAREVDNPSFRWYRPVGGTRWSGRVDGLEVCVVDRDGSAGKLDVGRPGRTGAISAERAAFLRIAGDSAGAFTLPKDRGRIEGVLRRLVQARSSGELAGGQAEHLWEARILRGAIPVMLPVGTPLVPALAEVPFQLPTSWTPGGRARYLDLLLRDGDIPWAVELKVPEGGGQGSYYRHAVTQAVLYREFIRQARPLHPWFQAMGLRASACRAAVAFPAIRGPARDRLLGDVVAAASDFDVEVVELDGERAVTARE